MKNEGLLKAPHSSERLQSYKYFRHIPNVLRLFYLLISDLDGIKDKYNNSFFFHFILSICMWILL